MKAVTMEDRMYSTCRAISSHFTNRDNGRNSLLKAGDAESADGWIAEPKMCTSGGFVQTNFAHVAYLYSVVVNYLVPLYQDDSMYVNK